MSTSNVSSENIAMLRRRPQAFTQDSDNEESRLSTSSAPASPGSIIDDQTSVQREGDEWTRIRRALPPQITGPYIRVISIGGVIGTGLFLGTGQSLRDGGPIGMLIGYFFTATIMWAVVVTLAEIIAYQPNVGGPVGLADVYVDQALGFAMGWLAWYNWTITLPTELSAAAIIASFYLGPDASADTIKKCNYITTSVMLFLAVSVNLIGRFGQFETVFSTMKICLIISLIITGIVIDIKPLSPSSLSAGITVINPNNDTVILPCVSHWFDNTSATMTLGVNYLKCPGAFVQYRDIEGAKGKILGVWSVMMQAIFAYSGAELPGIAGAEVENPGKNIPRATRNIWTRIVLFYILAVFVAGLIVPHTHPEIFNPDTTKGRDYVFSSPFIIAMNTAGLKTLANVTTAFFLLSAWSAASSDVYISSRYFFFLTQRGHAPRFMDTLVSYKDMKYALYSALTRGRAHQSQHREEDKRLVVPIYGVGVAALFGLMSFLPIMSYSAGQAFVWLSALASAATMLSWVSMMVTYLRWYAGIKHAQSIDEAFDQNHTALTKHIHKHRAWGQPYLAYYAIVMCGLILLLHGWAVFDIEGVARIAEMPKEIPPAPDRILGGTFPLVFVTSYLPVPVFLLCVFGYKLTRQTNFVELHEMDFSQTHIPAVVSEKKPTTIFGKIINYLV